MGTDEGKDGEDERERFVPSDELDDSGTSDAADASDGSRGTNPDEQLTRVERSRAGDGEDIADAEAGEPHEEASEKGYLRPVGGELDAEPEGPEEDPKLQRITSLLVSAIQSSSESFSGLLPHPDHWERYGQDWQERIARMAEAFTTDESERRDRIVDAQIKDAGQSRRAALMVMFGAFICALVAAGIFHNTVVAVAFLAIPVMQAAMEFMRPKDRGGTDRSKEPPSSGEGVDDTSRD